MTVLLADDEAPALSELSDAVASVLPDAQMHCFTKAREAMEFAEKRHIDIAFLDINMRFMNGIVMAKKLSEKDPMCNIIFCTGYDEYALEALNTYCSGYLLKPISTEKLKDAIAHLRYPITNIRHRVKLVCFGSFDVLCDDKPVSFKYKKTRELLAYLVDRNGAEATTREIMAAIFEEDNTSYFSNIRLDLINTFKALGVSDSIITDYGRMRVVKSQVDCDYYDYLEGKSDKFQGEYMSQYSFAESTCAELNKYDKYK